MDEWIKHDGNPIFEARERGWDNHIEDFVVTKRGGKYYAFYCGGAGYENLHGIGLAESKSPLGPFTRASDEPMIETHNYVRLGSIIRVGGVWRLYYSIGKGNVYFSESKDMLTWDRPFGPVVTSMIQPCCQRVGDGYVMLATDMNEKGIVSLTSPDGIQFSGRRKILRPKEGTSCAFGLSNPSFVEARGGGFGVFFEGRAQEFIEKMKGHCGWNVFEAMWDGESEIDVPKVPAIPLGEGWESLQTANANISRFGDKEYLYYGGYGESHRFKVGVAWRKAC